MRILVTGATGFIGTAISRYLSSQGHSVVCLVRNLPAELVDRADYRVVPDILSVTAQDIEGVEVVIHTAGLAHGKNGHDRQLFETNVDGSLAVCRASIDAHCKKLILLSSTKAVGEGNLSNQSLPRPVGPYAQSKRQSETELLDLCAHAEMELVCLRIPVTYGVGVAANFKKLISLTRSYAPIPYGLFASRKSYLYVKNLARFVERILTQPEIDGHCLFVTDPEPIELGCLLRELRLAQGLWAAPAIPMPVNIMKKIMKSVLPPSIYIQLFEDAVIDISETQALINWVPSWTTENALKDMFGPDDEP
jgi:nucleoside-diphosphate-sugar epimerase